MNLIWILLVIGMISFEEVNSVMHWKAKPRNGRARVRPLRQSNHAHHPPSSYRHRPIHRAHKPHPPPPPPPGYHRHRMPHHHVPIKSYQPPTTSLHYAPTQQTSHSHPHSQVIKHPQLFKGQPTHFKQDEYFKQPAFPFSHVAQATSNVEHATTPKFVSSSSDNQQHGYMASNYKGWRPIVKPYHSSYMHGAKYHGKDAYYNLYSPQNGGKTTGYENYNMNTLFRDSLKHVKPLKQVQLKSEYSENRGVVIPMPSEVGSNVRLPTSFFMDNSWNQFYNPTVLTSQSEEVPVIRKPFPKFTARLKNVRFNSSTETPATTMQTLNAQNEEGNRDESGRPPPSVPKYKISKPKLRPHPAQQQQQQQQQPPPPQSTPQKPEYNNEQEMDSIRQLSVPKNTDSLEVSPQSQTPLNLKAKLSRGRTRVRTKQVRPDGFVNTEEVSQAFDYRPAQSPVTSKMVGGRKNHKKEHSANNLADEGPRNPFPTAPSNSQTESEENSKAGNNSSVSEPFPQFPMSGFPMTMPPPDFFRNAVNGMNENKDGRFEMGPTAPQTSNSIHDSQSTGPERKAPGPSRQHQRQQQRHREGGREGGGRRRVKNPNQNQNQNQNQNSNQDGPNKNEESPQAQPQRVASFNENSGGFTDEFYFPPGFNQESSPGGNPVSFMTMPGDEKPQVIHHSLQSRQPSPTQQQQLYPINVIRSPEYQKQAKPLHNIQNIRAGPSHSLPTHNGHNHNLNQNSHSHSPLDSPGIHVPYQHQHPANIRGTNQNGNFIRNNRPQYVILNIQNGKEQELGNAGNRPNGVDSTFAVPNHTPIYPHSPQFTFGSNLSPQTFPLNSNAFQSGQHGLAPFTTLPSSPFFQNQGAAEAPTTLRSQFSGNDGGNINYFPSAPPLRYEAFEATNGYSRQPNNNFQSPSNQIATQLRQQLPRPQTRPFGPPNGNHRQQQPRHGPTSPRYSKNPADMNIFNDEFENIPMEFLDQLRPILLGEEQMANSPVPATVTPASRHVHQSPEIHPPSSFFDNFFQPFDENYRTETTTEQEVNNVPLTTPNNFPGKSVLRAGGSVGGQRGSGNRNAGYDMYKASSIKQYQVVRPNANRSETPFPWPTNTTPVISFSPMQEFASAMSTVSPIHDIDFFSSPSNSPISWSKLKFGENGLSSTESFLPPTLSSQFRKPLTPFNQTHQQKPSKLSDKKNSFSSYNGQFHPQPHQHQRQHYDVAPVTTYKPSFGNLQEIDVNTLRVAENFPSVSVQTTPEPLPLSVDEDSVSDDSNTPRSVRIRTTTESYDSQVTTDTPEGLQSTSTHKSRRHFRKRRPEQTDRKRYFSSRVKQSIDAESEKGEEPPVTTHRPGGRTRSTSKTDEGLDDFEASRASVLRRRRLFPRRKNLLASRTKTSAEVEEEQQQQQQQQAGKGGTTPTSSEPEPVTYGESQWFKLKQPESSEDSMQPPLSKNEAATTEKVQKDMQESPSTNSFSKLLIRPQDIQLVPLITSSEALAEAELASTKPY